MILQPANIIIDCIRNGAVAAGHGAIFHQRYFLRLTKAQNSSAIGILEVVREAQLRHFVMADAPLVSAFVGPLEPHAGFVLLRAAIGEGGGPAQGANVVTTYR